MNQSKLIQILSTLSKDEFIQFRKVLQSPFFVSNDIPLKLYDSIRRYYPVFDSAKLLKTQVFKKIYPDRPYDDNRMRDMMRKLTQLLNDFLVWLELKKNKQDYQKRLVNAYSKRPLFDWYQKSRTDVLNKMESMPYRGLDYYQDLFELHHDFLYHPERQKFDQKDETLEQLADCLDKRFVLSKLQIGIEIRNQERITKKKFDFRFSELILSELTVDNNNIALQLFGQLFKIFDTDNHSDFKLLENLFFPNINMLRLQDIQLIYFYGLNYINRKVNESNPEFSSKAFEWYKFGLKDGLLIQNKKISEISFSNIIIYGCRKQDFNWTKLFIEEYCNKVHAVQLEDLIQFNWGLWHFYKGALEEAFSLLNKYNFHHSFQLKVRLTSIRVLFEQFLKNHSYYDALISYAKAFQKFIQRESLYSETVSIPLKKTIEIIKTLSTKIMNREKKSNIQKWFDKKMEINKNIVAKMWLEEKVNALGTRNKK